MVLEADHFAYRLGHKNSTYNDMYQYKCVIWQLWSRVRYSQLFEAVISWEGTHSQFLQEVEVEVEGAQSRQANQSLMVDLSYLVMMAETNDVSNIFILWDNAWKKVKKATNIIICVYNLAVVPLSLATRGGGEGILAL